MKHNYVFFLLDQVSLKLIYQDLYHFELIKHGVNIVICANQLLRAAFPAMQNAAKSILKYHRAHEIDEELLSIKDIITLIDEL